MEFKISPDFSGIKLSKFLKKSQDISFAIFQTLLRKKKIKINEIRVKDDVALVTGDIISVFGYRDEQMPSIAKKNIPSQFKIQIPIIANLPDYLVINKPYNICSQAGTGVKESLIDILKAQLDIEELYLLHRLDKQTTGVMLIAKKYHAAKEIGAVFQDRKCHKIYYAWCLNQMDLKVGENFIVNSPIERDEKILDSKTTFTVMQIKDQFALLKCIPETGRYHQIRIHLAEKKCYILGERKHIDAAGEEIMDNYWPKGKLMLHAREIHFLYNQEKMHYIAPWPASFIALGINREIS